MLSAPPIREQDAIPTPQPRIRVLAADDHPLIRKMVAATFLQHAHIDVVGETKDGAEAVELAKQTKPDVVVLNINCSHRSLLGPNPSKFPGKQDERILVVGVHALKDFGH
jgi:chemotaxis response regulator CheB